MAVVGAGLAATQPASAAPRPAAVAHSPAPASSTPSWLAAHGRLPATHPGDAAPLTPRPHTDRVDPAATSHVAPNGTVRATISGDPKTVPAAVVAAGGRVLVAAGTVFSVVIPAAQIDALASHTGVDRVERATRPVPDAIAPGASQGVAASGANAWQQSGNNGSGVKVAIVDAGFGMNQAEYNGELSAGHLGSSTTVVNEDCTDANNAPTPYDGVSHGLAVAEIAQQEAPDAQLVLYCVGSPAGVAAAEADIESKGIKIVSSSLSWFGDARGDGTGPAGSVAATVMRARKQGILWIESAGNYVFQHWSGSLADADRDHYVDMGNANANVYPYESDFFTVAPGSSAQPTSIALEFQWDQWQTSSPSQIVLQAYGLQCTAPDGSGGNDNCQGQWIDGGRPLQAGNAVPGRPAIELDTSQYANTTGYEQVWQILVYLPGSFPVGAHYDLFGLGDTYYASSLACPSATNNVCNAPAAAKQGSVTSPANSPYALAAGAVDVGADGQPQGTLENFSSQGPTIDGRVKPDIAGWDGVSSYLPEFSGGFYGTSAAAPHIAGAAALVAAANPAMDAAQLQAFLEQRANNGAPSNPPTNQMGHGTLTLGASTGIEPPGGASYTALPSPVRILSTRDGPSPVRLGKMTAGQVISVPIPSAVPSTATAVAVNLTGAYATGITFMSVYPTTFTGTSNLNLDTHVPTAAVGAVVPIGPGRVIKLRNDAAAAYGILDLVGYFAPSGGSLYTPMTPSRLLSTRDGPGKQGPLGNGQVVTLRPTTVPAGATAVVVNVLAVGVPRGSGNLVAYPSGTTPGGTSTLNYAQYHRANVAVVGLSGGAFSVMNRGMPVHVVVDLLGYFAPGSGLGYVPLPSPVRIADTATGNGGRLGSLAAGSSLRLYTDGIFSVPYSAGAVMLGVTTLSTNSGFLVAYPDGVPVPPTSNVNYDPNIRASNGVFATTGNKSVDIESSANGTRIVVDLFGYFA